MFNPYQQQAQGYPQPPQQQPYPPHQPPTVYQPPAPSFMQGGYNQPQYGSQQAYPTYNPQQPQQMYASPPFASAYNYDEQQVYSWFSTVDSNKSGSIDYHELRKALQLSGFSSFSAETAKRMIRMFDNNKNGTLGFKEFYKLHKYLIQMQQAFQMVDLDKNGTLDIQETFRCVTGAGVMVSGKTFGDLFARFDTKNLKRLTFDEYIDLCVFIGTAKQIFARYEQPQKQYGYATFTLDTFLDACTELYW